MSIGPRKRAEIPDWAREALEEESFEPSAPRSVGDHRHGAAWPLFIEAAMVTKFAPRDLQPGLLSGEERKDAENEVLRFAEISPSDDGVRWSLTGVARRAVLEQCEPDELLDLVTRMTSDDPVQTALRELVQHSGEVDVASIPTNELESMRVAMTWLSRTKVTLPPLAEIDRELELRSLLAPFERMTGKRSGSEASVRPDRFFGRDDEIEALRAYVGVVPADRFSQRLSRLGRALLRLITGHQPVNVWGAGGVGKTTLIAVFMLEHARAAASKFPFVYLDFDRSTISASNRAALLSEMCRQVGAQFAELTAPMTALRERLAPYARSTGRNAESDEISRLLSHLDSFRSLIDGAFSSQPFLLVFDTFEVVQYGPDQVLALEELIRELGTPGEGWPRLRLVISGRAQIEKFLGKMQSVPLGALDREGSIEMIELLAKDSGKPISRKEAERLIDAVVKVVRDRSGDGVRPLRLRLLGELFRTAEGTGAALVESLIEEFTNPKSGKKQAGEMLFNGIVVRRTIGHVRDRDVAALADPGLVVRRITKDVIRDVMTRGTPKPTGEDPGDPESFEPWNVDDATAQKIFDAFGNEVSLVVRDGDALRHRQDVRQDMLPLIRDQRPRAFARIHGLAFEHFLEKTVRNPGDAASRGEVVYHGLWLDRNLAQLDPFWPSADPQIDENEFEPGSPQDIFLRLKRNKKVTSDEVSKLPPAVMLSWLAQRSSEMLTELRVGDHVEMIRVIGGDGYETFDSRRDLAAVAARVLYRAGRWREAALLLRRHLSSDLKIRDEGAVSLVRTWATIAAKSNAPPSELEWAEQLAQRIEDPLIRSEVLAHVALGRPQEIAFEGMAPHADLQSTMKEVRPPQWRREMRVLRLVIATGAEGTEELLRPFVEGTRQLPRDVEIAKILSRMRGKTTELNEIDSVWEAEKRRYHQSRAPEMILGLCALAAADHSDWMVPFGNAITRGFETHAREIGRAARGTAASAESIERALKAQDGHSVLQVVVADGMLVRFADVLSKTAKPIPYPETAPEMAQAFMQWHYRTMPEKFA